MTEHSPANPKVYAQLPVEFLQKIAPLAEQLGIAEELPGIVRMAPTIDLSQSIRPLALQLGQLLARQNLFLRGTDVVTVDGATGELAKMTGKRFCGWAEEFCAFAPGRDSRRTRHSMTREEAEMVLEQDIFRACLRPLRAVHAMRLPVLRASGKIEFLEAGYDEETQIYTVEALRYALDMSLDDAVQFLEEEAAGYPWAWASEEEEKAGILGGNRNWSAHLCAMVGVYCQAMFAPGTPKPMVTYIGNQAGTGKSTLVAMALMPVFGHAATTDSPQNDEQMSKVLETAARARLPYLFLDDVRYGLDSAPMNRFITSTKHSGRVMGGNSEMFAEDAVTQVFATGNQIKLTDDLTRRSLIVQLFLAGEVRGRRFRKTISVKYLAREEVRQRYLAALCAIVRDYQAACDEAGHLLKHERPLESFEEFTELVAAMVARLGYVDPLKRPEVAANEDEDDMREMLIKAASEADGSQTFDRKQLVEIARLNGLLESLVGSVGDGEIDAKTSKRFGRQLQRWRGRELVDQRGRKFRFGHRRQKSGATYPLQFI